MKKTRPYGKLWLLLAVLLTTVQLLVACGGGGGGGGGVIPSGPEIGVNTQTLSFSVNTANVVSPAATQTFTVTNTGTAGTTLTWTAASDQTWATIDQSSGSLSQGQSATIALTVSTAGLPTGGSTATVTVSASGLTSKTVTVQVNKATPAPVISLSSTALTFSDTSIAPQSVTVSNTGDSGTSLEWTATSDQAWLTVNPASGSTLVGTPAAFSVTLGDYSGLTKGMTHNATITVAATGLPSQTIDVALTLAPPPGTPAVSLDKTTMSFTAPESGTAPAAQTLTISNTGADNSTLDWTASSNQSWLAITPATSGSLAKGGATTLNITPNISGLLKGTYTATVTVTGAGVGDKTVAVTLTIGAALSANPTALSFTASQGASPAAQSIALANASAVSIAWTASDNADWLTVSPTSGSLAGGGQSTPLQVSVNSQTLAQGSYSATITVSATGGSVSAVSIPVTLTVSAPVAAASSKVFVGGTAGIGQLSGLLGAKAAVRKAATGQTDILPDAKVTITVVKPDGSKTVQTTKTNAQGAYSLEVAAATGDKITVVIEKDGFTTLNKTVEVKSASQTQYTVSGSVAQATVQVVKAENGVFKAGGGTRPGFRFGLMRSRTGEQIPFATGAGVRAAAGSTPDLDINIPASWAPNATALKTELAAFNPAVASERQMFPGAFVGVGGGSAAAAKAETTEYALESVSFFQADVAPNSGQPLTPTLATGASKAAAEATLIYKWIPREGCGAMQKYTDRDTLAPGVQVPIYTYNPNDGKWGYLGEGTLKLWNGLSYDTVLEGTVVDQNNGGKLTKLACGTSDQDYSNYYFEILATNWYTWWNLDYPLLFAQPTVYTITGKVVDQNGKAIPGAYVEADGYKKGANSYAYTYAGNDGTFAFDIAVDDPAKLANYEYAAYNYATWPATSTVFTAKVDTGSGATKNVGNIEVVDTLACTVKGKILQDLGNSQTKAAPEGTWVDLSTSDYSFYNWVYTDATGLFTSKAPCGVPISLQTWNGSYSVNVNGTVIGKDEATDDVATKTVTLKDIIITNAAPEVWTWIYPNPVKAGQPIELWASAWDYDGDYPLTYAWTIRDDATQAAVHSSALDGFSWTPPAAGAYTAELVVTDKIGKTTTRTETVTVNPDVNTRPEIYWTWAAPPSTCGGYPVLYVYAYDPEGDDLAYTFSQGAPQYDYNSGGWVPTTALTGDRVTVTVTDNGTPAMNAAMDIYLPQASDLQFYADVWPEEPTVGSEVELYAFAYNGMATYAWAVTAPDGSTVTPIPFTAGDNSWVYFVPDQQGTYTAVLTVTGGACTQDSATKTFSITTTPLTVTAGTAYMQYRTYEDPTRNRFQAWADYKNNGQLMNYWDFYGSFLFDASGILLSDMPTFWAASFLTADWNTATSQFGQAAPGGFSGFSFTGLASVPAGSYSIETELAGGAVITSDIAFPGQTALPVVASSSMTYQWQADGSLTLSWSEPVGAFDSYRIVFYDANNAYEGYQGEMFYGTVPPGVNTVTLSASLLQAIRTNAGISSLSSFAWEMQTRNYDGNNMNYARGYSNKVTVNPPPGSVNVIIR